MARGCLIKRCPICRGKKKMSGHQCSPHEVSYYAVYWVGRKQKWKFAGHTRREAEFFLKQKLAEIDDGTYRERKQVLFKDFVELWLVNVPKPRVKESTFRGYQTDVRRHLMPFFGSRFLDEVRQEDVETFLSQLMEKKGRGRDKCDKKLDPKTINNIRVTLSMVFDYARRLKYIQENPVADIRPFKVEKEEMDFLEPYEIRLLLKHAREPFKTLFMTAIMTGMRRAELAALQWGDIDWRLNTIFVRRSLYWRMKKDVSEGEKRWKFVTPKSKRSVRGIVMSPMLKEALEIHRLTSRFSPDDLVFCSTTGGPMDMDNMYTREFLTTLSMAGIRRVRFHDLRHTYATILNAQGENPKLIQNQLGHASIQTTMDTYGHMLPINHEEVGAKTDKFLFENLSNKNLTSVGQVPTNSAKEVGLDAVPVK